MPDPLISRVMLLDHEDDEKNDRIGEFRSPPRVSDLVSYMLCCRHITLVLSKGYLSVDNRNECPKTAYVPEIGTPPFPARGHGNWWISDYTNHRRINWYFSAGRGCDMT